MNKKVMAPHIKNAILHYAQNSDCTQKRIAELVGVSPRSVYRVLQEAGLLTHMPRMTKDVHKAMQALEIAGIKIGQVSAAMALLSKMGVAFLQADDKVAVQIPHSAYQLTRGQIIKAAVDMEEGTWASLLKDIVTGRTAKNFNVGVQTAMLNISNAVDKNAKPKQN